jgi:hypothetical protein
MPLTRIAAQSDLSPRLRGEVKEKHFDYAAAAFFGAKRP